MSFLSRPFKRQPADKAAATPAATTAAPSSKPDTTTSPNRPTNARLHLVPPERARKPSSSQPRSEGALAISQQPDEDRPRRRRRSRRRGKSAATIQEQAPQHEPILFPLPTTPGL